MKPKVLPEIQIYTDGTAVPNPGPGGWAAILLGENISGELVEKEITGSEPTTSIRMELRAAARAFWAASSASCAVFSAVYLAVTAGSWHRRYWRGRR